MNPSTFRIPLPRFRPSVRMRSFRACIPTSGVGAEDLLHQGVVDALIHIEGHFGVGDRHRQDADAEAPRGDAGQLLQRKTIKLLDAKNEAQAPVRPRARAERIWLLRAAYIALIRP